MRKRGCERRRPPVLGLIAEPGAATLVDVYSPWLSVACGATEREAVSVESISWALRAQNISAMEKLVLIGIANHDGDGGAWPSIATLAMYANASTRTVQRCVQALADCGFISIEMNMGGTMHTRADRRPNHYVIHRPKNGVTSMSPRDGNGVTSDAQRGDTAMSPEPSLNHPKPSLAQLPLSVPDPFDTFWEIWPRRVGKGAAKKAFDRAIKRASVETIFAGARRMASLWATMPPNDRQFVPYPERWLNADRWADEIDVQLEGEPRQALPQWIADADCPDCSGSGWKTIEEGSMDVGPCHCRKEPS